jgi:hypothetical protein
MQYVPGRHREGVQWLRGGRTFRASIVTRRQQKRGDRVAKTALEKKQGSVIRFSEFDR